MMAAHGAVKEVFVNGGWQMLEPIMSVEVTAPEGLCIFILYFSNDITLPKSI